jgi:hypothetical protein
LARTVAKNVVQLIDMASHFVGGSLGVIIAEHGHRCAMMFFDMDDASEVPGTLQGIGLLPVMNAEDLKGIGHRQIGDVRTTGAPCTFAQFVSWNAFPILEYRAIRHKSAPPQFLASKEIGVPPAPITLCDVFSPSQRKIDLPSAGLEIHKSYDESSSKGE